MPSSRRVRRRARREPRRALLSCSSCVGLPLVDRDQILTEPGQVFQPVLRHYDVVLDPDPETALEVDPRLDRDHVAGLERVAGLCGQARRLVDVEPQTVAEPVAELAL